MKNRRGISVNPFHQFSQLIKFQIYAAVSFLKSMEIYKFTFFRLITG